MLASYSLIRKPRYWLSKKSHRFKGFKIGQVVWYDRGKTLERYIVTGYDDCYDSCGGRETANPRKDYNLYIETKPWKKHKIFNPLYTRRDFNVMTYNQKLWNIGHIGHSVDPTKLFHTKGEALFACLS